MLVKWEDLVCGYNKKSPLHKPFSGSFLSGHFYGIIGPNGCGKSTFLKTILGIIPTLEGNISFIEKNSHKIAGYVPQSQNINKYFPISVYSVIHQGFGLDLVPEEIKQIKINKVMENWDLNTIANSNFHALSLGQKSRVLVARALVSEPKIIFLDEPLASIDIHCQHMLINLLHQLTLKDNTCVVIIDHHLEHYSYLLSDKIVFERGESIETCAGFSSSADICRASFIPGPYS